jgi:hypothetical protein
MYLSDMEDEIIRDHRQGPVCAFLSNRASSFALYAMAGCSLSHQGYLRSLINRQPYSFAGAATFTHDKQIPLMLRRAVQSALRRPLSTMSTSQTPMEDAIRTKVTLYRRDVFFSEPIDCWIDSFCLQINEALKPTSMEIFNDSHKHAHHQAMKGSTSRETHFR